MFTLNVLEACLTLSRLMYMLDKRGLAHLNPPVRHVKLRHSVSKDLMT